VLAFAGSFLVLLFLQSSESALASRGQAGRRSPTVLQAADIAIRLAEAVFPDWKTEPLRIELYPDFQTSEGVDEIWLIAGDTPTVERGAAAEQSRATTRLRVRIHFAGPNRIGHTSWSGAAVRTPELEQLRRDVASHPEWSDAEVSTRLDEAGAKFGPAKRQALLARVARLDLTPFYGRVAKGTIHSVEFVRQNRNDDFVWLEWRVILVLGQESVMLSFEPFDGRLISSSSPWFVTPPTKKDGGDTGR
jgi:hypothetical protein